MMLPLILRADQHAVECHVPASWSVGMTDRGLVCGAGSVLAHMVGKGLAADVDGDRVMALLSIVAGKPLPASEVMHHVEAASAHWKRGDKALANLRLVFAGLPRPTNAAAVDRLALSERLLDDGLASSDLMKALWPLQGESLRRYNRDEPRVPAGNGVESGRWEFAGGSAGEVRFADGRIVVAANPGVKGESYQEEKLFEERDRLGEATPAEEVAHGRAPNFFTGLPTGVGRPSWNAIDAAARDALSTVGPGRGPKTESRWTMERKVQSGSTRSKDRSMHLFRFMT